MFDTFVHRNVTERVTENVNVTEKRAPTDESIRQLREMEAAARAEVMKAIRVSNTNIEAVIHHRHDVLNDQDEYAIVYKVNGLRQVVKHTHRPLGEGRAERMTAVAEGLIKALSEDIARHLLGGMGKQISESLW